MSPLEAALVVAAVAALVNYVVVRKLNQISDPRYLRNEGVVIVADSALEERASPIGHYRGAPIWASVTFKGMRYRFDHIIDGKHRERIAPGELFLEPGLVYALK